MACLALVATVVATGVPALHASAHTNHEGDHETTSPAAHTADTHTGDHEHGDVHSPSLHDDSRFVPKFVLDLSFIPVASMGMPPLVAIVRAPIPHFVHRLPSRAPPPTDSARAPPLA